MSKAKQIREAMADYKQEFDKNVKIFTNKEFFYFFMDDNKKFIHKDSLRFRLTNADTYGYNINPEVCLLEDRKNVPSMEKEIKDIFDFIINTKSPLMPELTQTKNFLSYEFIEGEPLKEITLEDFYILKEFHEQHEFTPFYNSMCYNIIRTKSGLKIVDFKHYERKDKKPFFVYMYNQKYNVNTLYLETSTNLYQVLEYLKQDYPIMQNNIKWINKEKD